jgi:transposase
VFLSTEAPRRILAYRETVDMRKSFNGLVALVQGVLQEDPLSGCLFVFFNRRGNYMKLVTWDRTGFCLFAKRLEQGRFRLPAGEVKQEISLQAFRLILDGIALGKRRSMR